jgi:hypothetical protein
MAFPLHARTKFYLSRHDTNGTAALRSSELIFAELDTKNCCACAYAQILPLDKKYFRLRLKCDGTRAETRFRLSAKRTSPIKSAGAPVQSTTGSRGVRISGINAGYNMFRGSVKSTGYTLHSPVSPSLPLPCVTVCHHISIGLYNLYLANSDWESTHAHSKACTVLQHPNTETGHSHLDYAGVVA